MAGIKKRRGRKIRKGGGKLRRMRVKRPLALQTHSFCERKITDLVMTVANETSAVGMFKSFNLDDINGASSYKNLFEYYRIDKVVATFRYKGSGAQARNDPTQFPRSNEVNPLLYFKVDHNDINNDSLLLMRQSMKTKEKQLSNNNPNFTITLKPAVQAEAYKSSLATTYIPKWGQWLSTDDGTVPHYGLKAYATAFSDSTNSPGEIVVSFKYYISFKNNE